MWITIYGCFKNCILIHIILYFYHSPVVIIKSMKKHIHDRKHKIPKTVHFFFLLTLELHISGAQDLSSNMDWHFHLPHIPSCSCLLFPGFSCFHLFLFQCASLCSFRVILGLNPLLSSVMGEYPMNLIGLFLSRLFSLKVIFLRPEVGHLVYSFQFFAIMYMLKSRKLLAAIVFSFFSL